ncbi:MAG TPA: hypothetical protein DEV97_00525 [Lachnospiraceae bacterium]|nr:hypothetical protein [Lachnospiraceae bacterium]
MISTMNFNTLLALDMIRGSVADACDEEGLSKLMETFNWVIDGIESTVVYNMAIDIIESDNAPKDFRADLLKLLIKEPCDHDTGDDDSSGDASQKEQEHMTTEKISENLNEYRSWPTVVFYMPGYGPTTSREQIVMRGFDLNNPEHREIRFMDTDFLICFDSADSVQEDGKYYLAGPSVIYAVNKDDQVRSLTEDEIMSIISACLHKEETIGIGEMPVLRLC